MKRESDTLVFCAVDSEGKIFYKNEVPAWRIQKRDCVEWQNKGRGRLSLRIFTFRDLIMKGVFVSTKNLDASVRGFNGVVVDTVLKDKLVRKCDGVQIDYTSKTIMRII